MQRGDARNFVRIATLILFAAVLTPLVGTERAASAAEWEFRVRFAPEVRQGPFTGRAYVFFSRSLREPRLGPNWFNPELFVAQDVEEWAPGEPLVFSSEKPDRLLAFPKPLEEMELAGYRAQAVVRFNPLDRNIGTGVGNWFSQVVTIPDAAREGQGDADLPAFEVNQVVEPREFRETKWSKLLRVRSELLSEFQGRDEFLQAAVILPAGYYDEPDRRFPTIFTIPGFGGTHFSGITDRPVNENNEQGVEFLRVVLDPSCPFGHHVFADSDNNGPVGAALVRELIPAFDRTFRSVAEPSARFLTGHSSGGWSSLWLQVTYPDHFGGVWSTAPDPVDFRDFQRINLYRTGENMYVDADGNQRPLARSGERVVLWYRDFADMEWTLGHGGQLHSFEAVFSPRGDDGKPLLVWDRKTGAIDTAVARTWEKYDIRLKLYRNWLTLGPKLKGKLNVFMGDADTFYLEGATVLLKQSLEKLGSDAVVEIHPAKDHSNLLTGELQSRIRREMVEAFLRAAPTANGRN